MHKTMHAAILSTLLARGQCLPAFAADTKVLDHHVANMKSGDLEGVLSDYAPDAVVVTPAGMVSPNGVFVGKDTRKLFTVLTAKDSLPGNKTMETKYETLGARHHLDALGAVQGHAQGSLGL